MRMTNPRTRHPHRPNVDLWLCPCDECTRLEWEANDQPGRLSVFRVAQRRMLTTDGLAVGRPEHEPCERGTVGCCITHVGVAAGFDCETW